MTPFRSSSPTRRPRSGLIRLDVLALEGGGRLYVPQVSSWRLHAKTLERLAGTTA
ncbi:hypothetical protein ACO2Q0_20555 [Phenylobacterium sp. VNQ135]|uniref:hypothetical protein n=1 Tax=Phenylobacterium sp. VNQ135 TaxID=3400922 RepID=UPI003C0CE894